MVILQCYTALNEKLEDARSDFVQSKESCLGLIEVVGEDAKLSQVQLCAFDLLKSLGRAKLTKKKILIERFTDRKVQFYDRVCD